MHSGRRPRVILFPCLLPYLSIPSPAFVRLFVVLRVVADSPALSPARFPSPFLSSSALVASKKGGWPPCRFPPPPSQPPIIVPAHITSITKPLSGAASPPWCFGQVAGPAGPMQWGMAPQFYNQAAFNPMQPMNQFTHPNNTTALPSPTWCLGPNPEDAPSPHSPHQQLGAIQPNAADEPVYDPFPASNSSRVFKLNLALFPNFKISRCCPRFGSGCPFTSPVWAPDEVGHWVSPSGNEAVCDLLPCDGPSQILKAPPRKPHTMKPYRAAAQASTTMAITNSYLIPSPTSILEAPSSKPQCHEATLAITTPYLWEARQTPGVMRWIIGHHPSHFLPYCMGPGWP